jgi:type VI secretion system protein ImpH
VLPARALAFHAGWLAGRTRHAEGLCKVLRQEFGLPVAVVPHCGHWLPIEPEDHSRLGFAGNRPERARPGAARLGEQANAGSKVWDRQYRFGLQLGPMGLAAYRRLLPGGPDWPALNAWVRQLAPASLRWSLQLLLHPAEQPPPRLGRGQAAAAGTTSQAQAGTQAGGASDGQMVTQRGAQLGISTWLGRHPGTRHRQAQRLTLRPGLSFLQRQTGT